MRLTYRQIEYVREVARHKSISAACKKLHISQSSVLAAIDIAEDVTGTRLFNRRKGHGIALTPSGHRFLVSAQRFLAAGEDFSRSLDQFSEETPIIIRIGCFLPFGALIIPPVVRLHKDQTGDCEIVLMEGSQVQLRTWLATGSVDLIITYDIGEEFVSGITPICKLPAHAVVADNDLLAQKASVSIEELTQKPMILLDLPETRTYLLELFDFATKRPKIGLRTKSYETVRSSVSNGLGISILNLRPPSNTSPDSPNLVRIPIKDKIRQPTLMVVDPYEDQKPGYVKAFIKTLYDYFHDLGPEHFAVVVPEYSEGLLYPKPDL